jgi:hypothetical protein
LLSCLDFSSSHSLLSMPSPSHNRASRDFVGSCG